MAQQVINVGSAPNDGTGDPPRTAFTKSNANFTELYAATAVSTRQVYTSGSGTYTKPGAARWIEVEMVGGGGGGTVGAGATANAGAGTASTFGSSFLSANGAGANSAYYVSGTPGTATGGDINIRGGYGGGGGNHNGIAAAGGSGGNSYFGGAGAGNAGLDGTAAATNSGSGGGGGGVVATSTLGGSGGSAGGYLRKLITSPSATYPYVVGAGGAAGSGSPALGGAGASGIIIVTEFY